MELLSTTYPQPVEQVNAALAFLLRNVVDFKIDPATVVLSGDSAGAHISSQVALITTGSQGKAGDLSVEEGSACARDPGTHRG